MVSQAPILHLDGVTKNFGGLQALKDVNLRIEAGDLRGIIGPNGAGKTTLFNVVTGEFKPSAGKVFLRGEDISGLPPYAICRKGLSRTFQLTRIFPEMTVYDSIWAGANSKARHPWNPVSRAHRLEHIERETLEICKLIGLEEKKDELAVNLSYGDQKVLEMAMALSTKPSVLLLDEPTQGVGGKEVDTIVEVVKKLSEKMTIVLIEHTIDVVMQLCRTVTVLTEGQVFAEGTPEEISANREVQRVYLGEEI
ncbi:MAG: amino acid transporter ATP-binding protein [Deltaproteobacteria bacterium]|nr:amino acid transporter ATP-binding protein [Deltaproteobacteria bacterium]